MPPDRPWRDENVGDLVKDPDELTNEYNNPAHADDIAKLKIELDRLRAYYDDDSDVRVKPKAWRDNLRKSVSG